MKTILLAATAFVCFIISDVMLTSCPKIEDQDGMNDPRAYYNYRAKTTNFDYQEAAGPFDTAIRTAGCWDPLMGGNDKKVIEACDACYETLKEKLRYRRGKVYIYKLRHPDGKDKVIKEYKF